MPTGIRTEANAFIEMARTAIANGDKEGAREILTHALDLDPNSTVIHYELGKLYESLDDPVKANYHIGRAAASPLKASTPDAAGSGVIELVDDDAKPN